MLPTEFHFERRPIDRDAYLDALKINVEAAEDIARRGDIELATKVGMSSIDVAWDLTRPGAYVLVCDLMPYLRTDENVVNGLLGVIKACQLRCYVKEDGEPIVGAAGAWSDTDRQNYVHLHELSDQHQQILSGLAHRCEKALPVKKDNLTSIEDHFRRKTAEAVEHTVKDFREELDQLFETWGGDSHDG